MNEDNDVIEIHKKRLLYELIKIRGECKICDYFLDDGTCEYDVKECEFKLSLWEIDQILERIRC